ncbi:MAG: hypothetical protein V4590_05830 [Bacteroidota bacterium]
MRKLVIFCVLIGMVVISCRKDFEGTPNAQTTPETYAVVDSVRRDSNNLLTTTVEGRWWGESKKGFIKGYEVSIDNQVTWKYTQDQKGTFLLNLPFGTDRGTLPIYVRAIDNLGQTDPTPAVMTFPVKNTPPSLEMDYTAGRRTSTFPAFRYYWTATDVDGAADIQSIEIVLNDTNKAPLVIPGNSFAASFVAVVNGGSFDTILNVFQNTRIIALPEKLNGVLYNQLNRIFIRSVDRVGAKSQWSKDSIVIKLPKSDLLMVNDYSTKGAVQTFYNAQLNALGAGYNQYDSVLAITNDLPDDVFTIVKTLDFYKRIVWFSDNPTSTLGLAQLVTTNFFQQGGRMFMVCTMPDDFQHNSSVFNFTPVQELVAPPSDTRFRMVNGDQMYPHIAGSGWPVLKVTSPVLPSPARPFKTFTTPSGAFTYDSICGANIRAQSQSSTVVWTGASNVLSKRIKVGTGKTDMVFCTLPLNLLNGNNNIDSFFRKALINELEF